MHKRTASKCLFLLFCIIPYVGAQNSIYKPYDEIKVGEITDYQFGYEFRGITISDDEKYFAFVAADVLMVYDIEKKTIVKKLTESEFYNDLALSPNGKLMITVAHNAGMTFYNTKDYKVIKNIKFDETRIDPESVTFSRDGSTFFTCDVENKIKLWDANKFVLIKDIQEDHDLWTLDLHPMENKLIVTTTMGQLKYWDLGRRKFTKKYIYYEEDIIPYSITHTGDGIYIVLYDKLMIYDGHSFELLEEWSDEENTEFTHVAVQGNGEIIALGTFRNQVHLIKSDGKELLQKIELNNTDDYSVKPVFSKSGKYLFACSEGGQVSVFKGETE